MKENNKYKKILKETMLIKKKYCVECKYFVDDECKIRRLYKECFRNNKRIKKENKND